MTVREPRPPLPPGGGCPWCDNQGCEHCRDVATPPTPKPPSLREALGELLEVADLRGDSTLPSPPDDPILWSARMQTAWDEARAALAAPPERECCHVHKGEPEFPAYVHEWGESDDHD